MQMVWQAIGPVNAAANFKPIDGARYVGVNKFLSAANNKIENLNVDYFRTQRLKQEIDVAFLVNLRCAFRSRNSCLVRISGNSSFECCGLCPKVVQMFINNSEEPNLKRLPRPS